MIAIARIVVRKWHNNNLSVTLFSLYSKQLIQIYFYPKIECKTLKECSLKCCQNQGFSNYVETRETLCLVFYK